MRHRIAFRKLGRTQSHRKALARNLITSLFEKESIITTEAKAKEFRPTAEKLITLAKKPYSLHRYRQALSFLMKEDVVKKLFKDLAPRFANRKGGYTRILKLGGVRWEDQDPKWRKFVGKRLGDDSRNVLFELVEKKTREAKAKAKGKTKKTAT